MLLALAPCPPRFRWASLEPRPAEPIRPGPGAAGVLIRLGREALSPPVRLSSCIRQDFEPRQPAHSSHVEGVWAGGIGSAERAEVGTSSTSHGACFASYLSKAICDSQIRQPVGFFANGEQLTDAFVVGSEIFAQNTYYVRNV
jgi:hypothetical protein